jgi:hypothetical protein
LLTKVSQGADSLVRDKVALTHVKRQQWIWLKLSNAFDCVSQKENILLNKENKIGVLTGISDVSETYSDSSEIFQLASSDY